MQLFFKIYKILLLYSNNYWFINLCLKAEIQKNFIEMAHYKIGNQLSKISYCIYEYVNQLKNSALYCLEN